MSKKCDLKIDWATHEAAKYACEHWHYSKCMPAGKLVKIGAWENKKYIGCVIYSMGANPLLSSPYQLKNTECCELTRVALTNHCNPVSRILSITIKFLKKQSPGIRLIVSYADIGQNHHGGIYQANNWIYEGCFSGEHDVMINGKLYHRRSAYSLFGTTRPRGSTLVAKSSKQKYLMPLDKEMAKQIEPLRKPYPKREISVSSIDSDAPGNQSGEGRAELTDTLQ